VILLSSALHVMYGIDASNDEVNGLMKTVNEFYAASPAFRAISNLQRTQTHDLFAVTGLMLVATYERATESQNQSAVAQAKAEALTILRRFGVERTVAK
jgi:hypothetical protein